MTLPSQFSLEEENFYKDIQDLVKKGSQNEKELSLFLERYKELLARTDLDDETFIINFAKAGFIIEASAKVYGIKVDNLWVNLEHVLESLKNKSHTDSHKKKLDDNCNEDEICDEINDEDDKRKGGFNRRKKKLGDAFFSSDDFLEIDNITGLLGKNMNESNNVVESKFKLCEKVPNMFIKNKSKKKKIDICLKKIHDDKDIIRLRDWVISAECLLIKEIYMKLPETIFFSASESVCREEYDSEMFRNEDSLIFNNEDLNLVQESLLKMNSSFKDEKNNNFDLRIPVESSVKEPLENSITEKNDNFTDKLNMSRESEVAKFPNVMEKTKDCLVDVDEVFWNPSKFQDVIPSKKMRAGKTNKLVCQLCLKREIHKKKSKKCLNSNKECVDSYFTPHVQPLISEPNLGIAPDEELHSAYKAEMKLIEQLKKVDIAKNANSAFYSDEKNEVDEDRMSEDNLMYGGIEDDDNFAEDLNGDKDFELPFPVTDDDEVLALPNIGKEDANLAKSDLEFQKSENDALKDHNSTKNSFAKNKELGVKISKWYETIADKIKLAQKRGALNMKVLANKIINAFPSSNNSEGPSMPFQDVVRKQTKRDVPRYFFACLQLANEGHIQIQKSTNRSLATDCMMIKRLNTNFIADHSLRSPSKNLNSSCTIEQTKRKRNFSDSPSNDEVDAKQKKTKCTNSCKRPKKLVSVNNAKRQRCSLSSVDSFLSE